MFFFVPRFSKKAKLSQAYISVIIITAGIILRTCFNRTGVIQTVCVYKK